MMGVKKYIRNIVSAVCLGLLVSTPAFVFADESQKATTLGTVVVTAPPEQPDFKTGDVDLEETTGFVTVIERDAFEGKMEDLAEVLQNEGGVQVRQAGGLGSFSTVSLRGSSSDQVMVFVDGVLLNDASGGGVDLSSISLSDVASIEVYRGVTPINFNKASIGGVVNIKTLRAKEGLKASATLGYGSFNTRQASGFVNHKSGKWDYLISAGYLASDNDFEFLYDNHTEYNPNDDKWEKRNNAQFDQENILAKAGYDFTDDLRVDLLNQWFSKDQGLPTWNNSSKADASLQTERNITALSFTANDVGPLHLNSRTGIDYSYKDELYNDSHGTIGLGRQKSRYITKRYGGDFFVEWLAEMNALSFMADYHQETYDPEDLLTQKNPNKSTRNTLTLGLQDSVFLFQDSLTITPALRYTHLKDDLQSATNMFGTPLEGEERSEDYLSPQIGIKYSPLSWLNFRSNLAKYVREPSFFELFGDRGFIVGNSDLKAEKGVNFDAGFEVRYPAKTGWLDYISFNTAYFGSNVDDLITFVYDSRGIGKAKNISEAEIRGVESEIRIDFLKYFRMVGNATWQDPVNKSQVKAFDGNKLPGRFKTAYLGRLEARYAGVKVYGEYVRETGMFYDSANLLPAKDKNEINSGISWLFHSFLFSLTGRNLTNQQYEDFHGYPMPGRAFYFTVGYRY
ncbi:MAG: TonB-dependent receptor [Deltaproteobacteria bacterium]|nr:TonB-dependent receptor [Deltaproteobacteria bacterium]